MYAQRLTIRRMGIAAILGVCLAVPVSVWAAPPSSNSGQPFAEILEAIRGVTQNWDKKLDSTNGEADGCNSDRFTCVLDGQAVRDNETGLVWEQSPDPPSRNWASAISHCATSEVGGRKGWHLPLLEQLASLVDTSNAPALPTDHPFLNLQVEHYWAASTVADNPTRAWNVFFNTIGDVDNQGKGGPGAAWCVRGGQSFDGNTHTTLH